MQRVRDRPSSPRASEAAALLSAGKGAEDEKRGGSKPQKVKAHTTYDADSKNDVYTSESDPTLRAWTDHRGNSVTRRLKHFSGYNVTSGRSGSNR